MDDLLKWEEIEQRVETTDKFHHIPVRNKNLFIDGSFRTIDISVKEGIKAVIGKLKTDPQGTTKVQKYLFDVKKWTLERAKAWVKEHKKDILGTLLLLYKEIELSRDPKDKVTKYFKVHIKNVDSNTHTARIMVSTIQKDRHGEIVLPSSVKKLFKYYKEHPVLMSSHKYSGLTNQIGETSNHEITEEGIEMDATYYVGQGNEEADWGWFLVEKDMAMYSIGFLPIKSFSPMMNTGKEWPKELQQFMKQNPRRIYTEIEMLEASHVTIGSNRGSLQMGMDDPTPEHCQYVMDVMKSFGDQIPELDNYEYKTEPPESPPVPNTNPDSAAGGQQQGPDTINDDSELISPVLVDNMKELNELMTIWKEGKVISAKNRKTIQEAIVNIDQVKLVLQNLLTLSEPKKEDKKDNDPEEVVSLADLTDEANKLKNNL